MGHHISGLIARREVLKRLDVDHENLDKITGLHAGSAFGEFVHLTERLIDLLLLAPRSGPIVYVETEYFGGAGGQGAAVFRDGEMIGRPDWREIGAINDALSKIGVTHRTDQVDAFEAVGLGAFRSNESFRENGTSA
jgi:hypothetical protein